MNNEKDIVLKRFFVSETKVFLDNNKEVLEYEISNISLQDALETRRKLR